jgi:hypothetical protein
MSQLKPLSQQQIKHLADYYFNISRGLPSKGIFGGWNTRKSLIVRGLLEEVPADEQGNSSKTELSQQGIIWCEGNL